MLNSKKKIKFCAPHDKNKKKENTRTRARAQKEENIPELLVYAALWIGAVHVLRQHYLKSSFNSSDTKS